MCHPRDRHAKTLSQYKTTCDDKVIVDVTSPSVGSQLYPGQQEMLVILRREHLLLLPVFLGHHLLHLRLLTKKQQTKWQVILFILCKISTIFVTDLYLDTEGGGLSLNV